MRERFKADGDPKSVASSCALMCALRAYWPTGVGVFFVDMREHMPTWRPGRGGLGVAPPGVAWRRRHGRRQYSAPTSWQRSFSTAGSAVAAHLPCAARVNRQKLGSAYRRGAASISHHRLAACQLTQRGRASACVRPKCGVLLSNRLASQRNHALPFSPKDNW